MGPEKTLTPCWHVGMLGPWLDCAVLNLLPKDSHPRNGSASSGDMLFIKQTQNAGCWQVPSGPLANGCNQLPVFLQENVWNYNLGSFHVAFAGKNKLMHIPSHLDSQLSPNQGGHSTAEKRELNQPHQTGQSWHALQSAETGHLERSYVEESSHFPRRNAKVW